MHFRIWPVILIVALGFAAYANSFNNKFIRDDFILVKSNPQITSASGVMRYFTGRAAIGGRQKWSSYRPFQMLTYALDHFVWKLDVRGCHFTNTALHILVALALYGFINILYGDRILSLFAGALFVVNPLHTEAVTYISGRADSLSALFMLLSFILYIKFCRLKRGGIYALMLACYALAVLSRENSMVLLPLLLLYHYVFRKKFEARAFFPLLGIAALYGLLRATVLKSLFADVAYSSGLVVRIPGFFVAIANYARLLVLPFDLHTSYGLGLFRFSDPAAISGVLITAGLLIWAFRKRHAKAPVFFSVCWFFIALLPQSNLYPINAFMAEHWLYLPSVGFFLVVAWFPASLYRRKSSKTFSLVLMAALLAFYVFLTRRQNEYWREPLAFYARTLKYAPDDYGEHVNLGLTYAGMGEMEKARSSFEKALALNPKYADAHYNLGKLQYERGEKEKAIASFRKTTELNPVHAEAHHNLGNAYHDAGRTEEAIDQYEKVIRINPYYADAYYALGNAYYAAGNREKASGFYEKALEINPGDGEVCYNLAVLYYQKKQYARAIKYCDRAARLGFEVDPKLFRLLSLFRK